MSVRASRLIPLLAACSAIGAVGNYLFLPALPQIGAHFGVAPGTAQLVLTTYLVSFACGVLLSGPLADRYGRRPVLIGGVAITGAAGLLCYFAPTMGWFIAARIVQGAAGGFGITVSRASVGDLFEERELARMYAVLTMALVLGTALAPYAGGLITRYLGWQQGFLWLAAAAGLIALACFIALPETRSAGAHARSFGVLWRESRILLRQPVFVGYVLQAALIYALFFVFVSLAPFVMVGILGMPTDEFGLYYLFLAAGFFIGNLLVSRSGGHHDVARQLNAGLGWQLAGACAALALVRMGFHHPLAVFVPMMAFCFGQGLALPNLIAHGIRLAPNYTGVASSMFGFTQLALAALAVQIMGFVPASGWQPALWFCVGGALLSAVGVKRLEASEDSPTRA
ncbi:MAG TPA: multidrug effflux MFS transporter [Steroidobacteraceae bacterium]|jgi:DHA1 family bicyclomycin/chloramphenicol resistance-like MFS transporter|nr:multidrug effflux MFS transporter [Steroidobacteraceae bacterium]